METFVKIWFAQISLATPKIWVAQNLEGRGEGGGCCSPQAPMVRTSMGANTFFFFN